MNRFFYFIALCFLMGCTNAPNEGAEPELVDFSIVIPEISNETNESGQPFPVSLFHVECQEGDQYIDYLTSVEPLERLFKAHSARVDLPVTTINLSINEGSLAEHPEAYKIDIVKDRISVIGNSELGLFRGIASIHQLLLDAEFWGDHIYIKQESFVDAPAFSHRGLLLDCCRHFMDKDFVKRYIDLLALYKMNTLHWHLTEDQGWRIEIDAYPKLTEQGAWRIEADSSRYGGFYTKEDIKEIVNHGLNRGIEIIPEIELPGHSCAAISSYPWLSCTGHQIDVKNEWGVFKDIYCAGNDSTMNFLKTVLVEVMELFPSDKIHIGGDEAPKARWEECDKCQKRIRQNNLHDEHELQSWFINEIGTFLKEHDKKLIGWDEILDGGIPNGAIVQSWRGMDGGTKAAKEGHYAIMSPTSHCYFDYPVNSTDLEEVYSFNPIPEDLSEELESLILGGECNMWSEHAPQNLVDSKVFPRMLAMAEVLWVGSENKNYEKFYNRVQSHYSILGKLGVDYGMEAIPLEFESTSMHSSDGNIYEVLIEENVDVNVHTSFELKKLSPNGRKERYSKEVNGREELAFNLTRNEKKYGPEIVLPVYGHKANFATLNLEYDLNQYYPASGERALVDGLLGTVNFRDGNWQAVQGQDMMVEIVLPDSIDAWSHFESHFYFYNNAWIFPPTSIKIEVSSSGEDWMLIEKIRGEFTPKDEEEMIVNYTYDHPQSIKMKYIRITAENFGLCPDWHDAAGEPSWLFCDELVID